jgi:hypothetical protein
MADLRELLEQAAGEPPTTLPLTDIRRRGTTLARRRQVVVGIVVAVAALLVGAVITRYDPPTDTPSTPQPSPTPVATPGPLPPGTYTDRALSPAITFTVPEGPAWRASLTTPTSLILSSDTPGASISVQQWTRVYPPITASGPAPATSPRPSDVIDWLAHHPALQITGGPRATHLGGQPAHRITFTLSPHRRLPTGPALGCTAAADCLLLADTPDIPVVGYPAYATTVIAPDTAANGLVVTVATPTGHLTATDAIVDTLAVG